MGDAPPGDRSTAAPMTQMLVGHRLEATSGWLTVRLSHRASRKFVQIVPTFPTSVRIRADSYAFGQRCFGWVWDRLGTRIL